MMSRTDRRNSAVYRACLATFIVLVSAGRGSADSPPVQCAPGAPSGSNIVYRPAYRARAVRTKQLYLSNYAGATYPPLFQRAPVNAASAQTEQPVGLFGWLRSGR